MSRLLLVLFVAVVGTSVSACSKGAPPPPVICQEADAGAAVDPALLAFLSKARAAHHRADLHEGSDDLASAIADLDRIVSEPAPGAKVKPIEVREVLADTYARLADLKSRSDRLDDADLDVARGLELASEVTYFRGHLFEVKGLVAERRGKALSAAGDDEGAKAAKKDALEAFERSMEIQAKVIEEALPSEGR